MILDMELRIRERMAREEGRAEREKEIIWSMASMQIPTEVIAKAVRSTPEFIEKVLNPKSPAIRP